MRYFLQLSYKGTAYHGWQIQPNATTVQQLINERLGRLLKSDVMLAGCGRTDTGVHARDFYAHFDYPEAWSQEELAKLAWKLDRFLPQDIAIQRIFPVRDDAHARFSAVSRKYRYIISTHKDPFMDHYAWHFSVPLDLAAMNDAAAVLMEYHDFACFSKVDNDSLTSDCTLMEAYWEKHSQQLEFNIKANRFLRNMVRAIVGTLINIGRGRYDVSRLREIIESGDRCQAGESAPAHGLYLMEVEYPDSILP